MDRCDKKQSVTCHEKKTKHSVLFCRLTAKIGICKMSFILNHVSLILKQTKKTRGLTLKQGNEIDFRRLLNRQNGMRVEAKIAAESLGNLPH
jgi:hypothetical protein